MHSEVILEGAVQNFDLGVRLRIWVHRAGAGMRPKFSRGWAGLELAKRVRVRAMIITGAEVPKAQYWCTAPGPPSSHTPFRFAFAACALLAPKQLLLKLGSQLYHPSHLGISSHAFLQRSKSGFPVPSSFFLHSRLTHLSMRSPLAQSRSGSALTSRLHCSHTASQPASQRRSQLLQPV